MKENIFNFILHVSKNFDHISHQPSNINSLSHFLNFQLIVDYDFILQQPKKIIIQVRYVNTLKKILLNKSEKINEKSKSDEFVVKNNNYVQINDNEIEIYSKELSNVENLFPNQINDVCSSNLQILFKDNNIYIQNDNKVVNISFPFAMNQIIEKDKRKIIVGTLISSENLDMVVEINSWTFNFLSGEIYNENSNLILISYSPPWPHNYIFNENTLKNYNQLFNLIFPLKTNLILLNQLWVDKKNLTKSNNQLYRVIDSVHANMIGFLQNLISFYMFDVIEIKFNLFIKNIKDVNDFEKIFIFHEEFLEDVLANSFIRSKKIMRAIFDILFTCRKLYNYLDNLILNLESMQYNIDEDEIVNNLSSIKNEFDGKTKHLLDIFSKIKNTKYFTLISQLMVKMDSFYKYNSNLEKMY